MKKTVNESMLVHIDIKYKNTKVKTNGFIFVDAMRSTKMPLGFDKISIKKLEEK